MSEVSTLEVAAYDMGYFPETQDESTEIGQKLVAKLFIASKRLIASSFQDAFGKNWDEQFMSDCKRIPDGEKTIIMYKNRPFLELGEMEEEFETRNGTQHLVINQKYRVL